MQSLVLAHRLYWRSRRPTPVHLLPNELLAYVFELSSLATSSPSSFSTSPASSVFLDPEQSPHPDLLPFGTETIIPPVTLSSVCRHWRAVAHATGSLWSRICITAELLDPTVPIGQAHLQTAYIVAFLKYSHNRPLDIVIDARDPYWDFSEPEIQSDDGLTNYVPPFSANHMQTALNLILPHLSRWRSIDIMTDTWVPMYTALTTLNKYLVSRAASLPMLESLTLMRCNDYTSYSPVFEPVHLKTPSFLDTGTERGGRPIAQMPRLRNLVLRGVHVDWPILPTLLPCDPCVMKSLELGSHARDVRPTESEFRSLLLRCPSLEKLSIDGSGPFESDGMVALDPLPPQPPPTHPTTAMATMAPAAFSLEPTTLVLGESDGSESTAAIPLHQLRELSLGYRSVAAGRKIMELLEAPNLQRLYLSDSTNPIDPHDVDAGPLLQYVARGLSNRAGGSGEDERHRRRRDRIRRRGSSNATSSATRLRDVEDECGGGGGAFPDLRELWVCGMKASLFSIRELFFGLPHLTKLSLSAISMDFLRGLVPVGGRGSNNVAPCPQLGIIEMKDMEFYLRVEDLEEILEIERKRMAGGAIAFKEIGILMPRRGIMDEKVREELGGAVDSCPRWGGRCRIKLCERMPFSVMDEFDDSDDSDEDEEDCEVEVEGGIDYLGANSWAGEFFDDSDYPEKDTVGLPFNIKAFGVGRFGVGHI